MGADRQVIQRLWPQSALDQLGGHERSQVAVRLWSEVPTDPSDSRRGGLELVGHRLRDLEGLDPDVRPDCGEHIAGHATETTKRLDGGDRDPSRHAAPTSMDGGHRARLRIRQQQRYAVRGSNAAGQGSGDCNQSIGLLTGKRAATGVWGEGEEPGAMNLSDQQQGVG